MSQDELKQDYITLALISEDIEKNAIAFSLAADKRNFIECFRQIKNAFLAYSMLHDCLKHFTIYACNDDDLIQKIRKLRKKLEFIRHLRNKCSGHLDKKVLSKAVQWEPSLFLDGVQSDVFLMLVYKTLLESAINSYCDEKGKQKYFGEEIDLFYPPNWNIFIDFLSESETEALDILKKLKRKIFSEIETTKTIDDLVNKAMIASQTDFRL